MFVTHLTVRSVLLPPAFVRQLPLDGNTVVGLWRNVTQWSTDKPNKH